MSNAPSPRLLVVDDEPDLRTLYELTLVREGYDVESAGGVEEAWALLTARGPDGYQLVITDMRMPDGNGLDLLRRMDEAGRREKGIVITAYGSAENAVEALKAGAYDYLTKPVDLRQFRAAVASALGRPTVASAQVPRERRVEPRGGESSPPARALQRMAGSSEAMNQVRRMVEKVARSMAPVLVQGESGTGKELVARAIHDVSPRSARPFVAVNCGAIPEALLESEFFGVRKGAFTGAHEDRDGFFQAAQGGTLFLDEIGDLPLLMQTKLLRVIQERMVRQVGGVTELPVDVRLVSATHKDLGAEVHAGRFRQDLFYRLNVIRIAVPALRERTGDLAEICDIVLERISRDAGVSPRPSLGQGALEHLQRYAFPGNVRELENLLHRAVALSGGPTIERVDLELPEALLGVDDVRDADPVPLPAPAGTPAASPLPTDLASYLDSVERDILERALDRFRYNRTAAGASLGLTLRQMRYRMARLGVGAADGLGESADSAD